jgi:hypothetical protein
VIEEEVKAIMRKHGYKPIGYRQSLAEWRSAGWDESLKSIKIYIFFLFGDAVAVSLLLSLTRA